MQYWVEKKARGRSDIPQWKRDQEPSLLNFDLAHVVEEWKHIAIRSTGPRFPPPQNETEMPAWRATLKRLNRRLMECFSISERTTYFSESEYVAKRDGVL